MYYGNDDEDFNNTVFYHVPYHPRNPPSSAVQRFSAKLPLQNPCSKREPLLAMIVNDYGCEIGIERLIVTNHKQKNLRELFFKRKFKTEKGKHSSRYGQQVTNLQSSDPTSERESPGNFSRRESASQRQSFHSKPRDQPTWFIPSAVDQEAIRAWQRFSVQAASGKFIMF